MGRAILKGDAAGAIIAAIASLPQAFAYGLIATSPLGSEWVAFGIASSIGTAIFFGLITGTMGSNPYLISGPRAVTALVIATAVGTAVDRGYEPATALSLAFAGIVLAGVFKTIAGMARLGSIISYMPGPVLTGFVMSSALLVIIPSIPLAVGLPETQAGPFWTKPWGEASLWALGVSGLTLVTNLLAEGRVRMIPAAVLGLFVGSLVYHGGIAFGGMPLGPEIGFFDLGSLTHTALLFLKPTASEVFLSEWDIPLLVGASVGLLAAFDTIFGSAAMDGKTGHESSINRDLTLHGVANTLMGCLGFLPGSGTLMRSTAAYQAGSRSRLAAYGNGIVVAIMLTVLAPIISQLPIWAAAGMLIATGILALDRAVLVKLLDVLLQRVEYPKVIAGDLFITIMVVITALVVDLIAAIGTGMALAIILFVLGMGRDPIRRAYKCNRVHSSVQRQPLQMETLEREGHRIGVIELKGALFFGSRNALASQAGSLFTAGAENLILDLRHLTSLDSTGAETIRKLSHQCREAGGHLFLSNIEPERRSGLRNSTPHQAQSQERRKTSRRLPRMVWLLLKSNGVLDLVGPTRLVDTVDSAIAQCEDTLLEKLGKTGRGHARGIIANSPLLKGLTRADVISLGQYAKRKSFDMGAAIFAQQDHGDSAYFLVTGRVDVSISIPGSSRKRSLTVLTEGALFGEMALLDGGPRSANVTASKRSTCFVLHQTDFKQLEKDNPELVLILMKNLNSLISDRLRIANTMISELEQ